MKIINKKKYIKNIKNIVEKDKKVYKKLDYKMRLKLYSYNLKTGGLGLEMYHNKKCKIKVKIYNFCIFFLKNYS